MSAQSFIPDYITPQPGEADSLERIFDALDAAIAALNVEAGLHLEQNDDAPAAALLFDRIEQSRKRLQEVGAAVEATAAQRMSGVRTIAIPGYIIDKKGGQKNHKWRDADVAWAALEPLAVDSNGVVDDSAADLIGQVRDRLLACASISYWRIDPLKALGVNPYDYRTSEQGRYTIRVTKTEDLRP